MGWLKDLIFVNEEKEAEGAAKGAKAPVKAAPPKKTAEDPADDIIRRYAGGGDVKPDASPARSPSGEAPPDFGAGAPAMSGGKVDFPDVFKKAGIPPDDMDRVEKALALLSQLPAETPLAVKKQIVETSLKAFSIPIEDIIETAVAEIQALHACIAAGAQSTQSLLTESEARITKLEEEILAVRKIMDDRRGEQRAVETTARAEGLRIQKILEFFGEEKVQEVVKDPNAPLRHSRDAKG